MKSLKSSLREKLEDLKHQQKDQECMELDALCEGSGSAILARQCELVDKLYNAWVKDEFEKKVFEFERAPFLVSKKQPPPVVKEWEETHQQQFQKLHTVIRREARKELSLKRDMLCPTKFERDRLEWLFRINSNNYSEHEAFLLGKEHTISFTGYQTALKAFALLLECVGRHRLNGYLRPGTLSMATWFTTQLYMKLSTSDLKGKVSVSVSSLMEYVDKKLQNYHLRRTLLSYDADGRGYITKNQFSLYLHRTCGQFVDDLTKHDNSLKRSFIDYIVCEIFFLLDPYKRSFVRIAELLGSRLLPVEIEFDDKGLCLPIMRKSFAHDRKYDYFKRKREIFCELLKFTSENNQLVPFPAFCKMFPELAQRIWGNDEGLGNAKIAFTESSIQRLVWSREGICYDTFLDITFAWENLGQSYSSIYFLFRALDTECKGYLELEDLHSHFKNVQEYWKQKEENDSEKFMNNLTQVQLQIDDMLTREGVSRITPDVLHKINGGHIIVKYLLNAEAVSALR